MPVTVLLLIIWIISCSGRPGKKNELSVDSPAAIESEQGIRLVSMLSPSDEGTYKIGSQVKISLKQEHENQIPDSILLSFDGNFLTSLKSNQWEYSIPSSFLSKTGRKSVKATAYKNGRARTVVTRFIVVLSDRAPLKQRYKVIQSYPHDRSAFTQGLFYNKGFLYEGTGQEAGSSLREVEIETGKIIRQLNLSPSLFGEGITLYKERIYQVTWTNNVGFVYDISTFDQINKFYYQTQGWGLTTVDDRIVMSDGTNALYFYEPDLFTVTSRIEVYDDENPVDSLNELEYIDGEIWANIWMTDLIARIDPVSGKVIAYIDLDGILSDPYFNTDDNVLNGIAYDEAGERIFVTGKNWPNLFEIKITE